MYKQGNAKKLVSYSGTCLYRTPWNRIKCPDYRGVPDGAKWGVPAMFYISTLRLYYCEASR